jgi:hypothetical protein
VTRAAVGVLTALLVLASGAGAEHEVYYRYVVLGYVKDARGTPLPGAAVELVRDKTALIYGAESDDDGLFLIIARLGDESAGETLTLRAGTVTARVVARFDPGNHTAPRGTRVDLEGKQFVERSTLFRPTLARILEPTPRRDRSQK